MSGPAANRAGQYRYMVAAARVSGGTLRSPRASRAPAIWPTRLGSSARWNGLEEAALLGEWGYPFPRDDDGNIYRANLRGPDYMHFMRRRALRSGVKIFDHHPALELLAMATESSGEAGLTARAGAPGGCEPARSCWRPVVAPLAKGCLAPPL